jgi:hypothetical protein
MLDTEALEKDQGSALDPLGTGPQTPISVHAAPRPVARRAAVRGTRWRLLHDPLAHFIALGTALFLIWPFIGARLAPPPNQIVISQGQMRRAIDIFVKTHARPPTRDEVDSLAEQEIQTEVAYREGIALGLDRDDEIIRRRIAQKLRFMIQDVAERTAPTDADLQRFLATHADLFGAEPRVAFSQVYLNPTQHGQGLTRDAARLLKKLNAGDGRLDYAADSDVLPVPNDFEATSLRSVASMFGDDFAAAIDRQAPGRWVGPIASGYGMHLVLVRQRIEGAPPQLAQVRSAVLREWQSAQRTAANAEAYQQMRAKYRVSVDMPDAPSPDPARN